MRYYPVFLDLMGRRCVVIGKGELADQKASALQRAGATVERSPEFNPDLVRDAFLAVAVVADPREAQRIKKFAEEHRILLNVVDQPEHCNFIAPAILERGDLVIAISTSGKSPALASKIRRRLEDQFGPEYAILVEALGEIRPLVRRRFDSFEKRKSVYQELVNMDLLEKIRGRGLEALRSELEQVVLTK